MSSNPPTTLGKYQIIREIARSNDIVYEAYDPLMNRRVAIKELAVPGGSTSQQKEDRVKRFLREARAAGSLQHKNIMTVFEVGEEGGRYFIAMEYLDGKTLRNEIDAKGFLPPDRAVEVAIGVLEGLAYAHSKGVIHRDIKPDNIQLTSNGGIKITDFGIARLTFEPNLTQDGQVFGTPSYMSPEQVVGRDIDARSDLFSVGTVLYEMLAGVKPFAGDSVVAITYAIMNKQPDRPQQVNYAMWQVLERALDKSPQLRFRDAADFEQALKNALKASQNVVIDPNPPSYQTQQPYSPAYGQPTPYQPYPNTPQSYPNTGPPPVVAQPQNPYAQPTTPYGTPNPYLPPTNPSPYPQPNPYGQTTPYGGYSQPYNQPNPYGANTTPYQVSGPQNYPPGATPVPVYYPPPPRRPLLSAQAKHTLGQVLGVMIVLGVLAVLVVMILNIASQRTSAKSPASSATTGTPSVAPGGTTAPVQISMEDATRQQAFDMNERGVENINAGSIDAAINDFREATRLDPTVPTYWENLGIGFYNKTREPASAHRIAELKRDAGAAYKEAFRLASGNEKRRLGEASAGLYLLAAREMMDINRGREARQILYDAREPARGTKYEEEISILLDLLSFVGD